MLSGLYITAKDGTIDADVRGALACTAQSGDIELLFEGALTAGRRADESDAEVALAAFESMGLAGLQERLRLANTRPLDQRPEISPETRARLAVYFEEDVAALQEITGRDLSNWLR